MKKIGRGALLVGAITFGLATPALAEVRVSQSADRKSVGSDDSFEVTVTVSGLEAPAELSLPRSPDLQILGQSQSTRTSLTTGPNGVASEREQQIHLQMRATRSGSVTIPGAVVRTGGATLRAQPLQLEVHAGHVAGPRAAADPNDPFAQLGLHGFGGGLTGIDPFGDDDDPFAQLRKAERVSPSDVRLVATLDRRSAVVGQQATLELWLLTRVGVSVGGLQMPKIDGALGEEIATPSQPKPQERTVDGVPYRAFLLAKRALFPQKAGRLDIGAAQADVTASGLLQTQRLTPRSQPLTLEVRAVPPGGPADEAIGAWTLRAELSSPHAAVGAPVTLRVSAQGTGDLKALTLPPLPAIAGVDAFSPTVTDTPSPSMGHGLLGGRRVAEIVLMPRRAGELTIPALALPYYDPQSGRRGVSRTRPIVLHVAAAPADASVAAAAPAHVASADAIHPLRAVVSLSPSRPRRPWRALGFWLLVALPTLFLGAAAAVTRRAAGRASSRQRLRAARQQLARADRP
ncbi:MAG: BatD family protein, partial [Myxococcales bacterium]|nr:BatD family protein [Myxococcales bacterium]